MPQYILEMTAHQLAAKFERVGVHESFTRAECEMLMRVLRSWGDMLAALRAYSEWCADAYDEPPLRGVRENVRAAIAKAEGR